MKCTELYQKSTLFKLRTFKLFISLYLVNELEKAQILILSRKMP